MTHRKLAQQLLFKADQDLVVLEKLKSDPDIAAEILGFHAQQAAEKILKAVLAYHQINFPYTHQLVDLIDPIKDHQLNFPQELEELRYLTPFAVDFRYNFFGSTEEEDEAIDIAATLELLKQLRQWAISVTDLSD
jgi:HEPN domain-containing protein